ncbi:MAG: metal-dependent hydrolase, partial [Desulfobacteraceae bacterium]
HRGPTHSLLFALLAGYLASNLYRLWHQIPRFSFGLCFILIFSHVGADMLLTATPVSLLWPLDLYFSPGHNSWGQIMHMVLFQSIQDVGIVVVCIAYVVSIRYIQSKEPLFPLFAFARRRAK